MKFLKGGGMISLRVGNSVTLIHQSAICNISEIVITLLNPFVDSFWEFAHGSFSFVFNELHIVHNLRCLLFHCRRDPITFTFASHRFGLFTENYLTFLIAKCFCSCHMTITFADSRSCEEDMS